MALLPVFFPFSTSRDCIMKSILVIEHSTIQRRMLKIALETHGISMIEAENGLVGLQRLDSAIQLILCALNAPVMDGIEFLTRKLKTQYAYIPVVMVSTNQPAELKQLCFELGAEDWLTKPFSVSDLQLTIEKYFS